jgi:4-amino-4-deoxy-L-arabinose transferase-like glycosyltransferase
VAITLPSWFGKVRWNDPDALFYQAKTLSFRGQDERAALYRTFFSPIADQLQHDEQRYPRKEGPQYTSPRWIDYNRRFFRRRPVVPLVAAAVYPIFGLRSLLSVSLLGYILLAVALYALLRRRFSATISVVATTACILIPPVRNFSFLPMTDSWGVLLETCALLAAVLTFDRGPRWLAAWIAAIAVLALTRDDTVVPLVAAGCLALHQRDRRSGLLVATGVAAWLPTLLLGNVSVRENLAYVFSNYYPPKDGSWSFVLHQYWPHFRHLVREDLLYGTHLGAWAPVWYVGLALGAAGLALLLISVRRPDPFFRLLAYSVVGGFVFLLLFGAYTGLRQELVLVPPIAVGLALLMETATKWVAARRRRGEPETEPQLAPAAASGPSPGRA